MAIKAFSAISLENRPAAVADSAGTEVLAADPLPKPRLVVRVGVSGHRPKDLPIGEGLESLRNAIRIVLEQIKSISAEIFQQHRTLYSGDEAVLRLISPLAEGADRLVADEALKQGYELQCPFPFFCEEYEKDFKTEESRLEFARLHQQASAVFELDGSRASLDEAYEAVGRVVLTQSDVVIAIWNGRPAAGRGGTGQIVMEALARGIPTVRIKPYVPHRLHLCRSRARHPRQRTRGATLSERLRNILEPPPNSAEPIEFLHREKFPKSSSLFKKFRALLASGYKEPPLPTKEVQVIDEPAMAAVWANTNALVGARIEESYRRRFRRTDALADIFADLYRSSFITTYAFGALAVLFAFFGIYLGAHKWFWIELDLIGSILILLWAGGRRGRWHVRWLDYRLLAEALRQMDFLAPLARVTPSFEAPAHLDQGDPSRTWFNWYFRAVVREAGMIRARTDTAYSTAYRTVLAGSILSQIKYHRDNAARIGTAHHRLHRAALRFFSATVVACLLHLLPEETFAHWLGNALHEKVNLLLSFVAVVFPALGAAVEGIVHQGEFDRIARRSKAMAARLETILRQVLSLSIHASSRELGDIAESFCEIQLQEQADWRSVFLTKHLAPP